MEYVEAQQASYIAYRLCRGMGHLYAHLPLGSRQWLINAQLQQSDRFLANSMVVYGQNTSKAYNGLKEGRPIDLNDKDMLITDHVYAHQVGDVGGQLQQYSVNINYGDNYIATRR